MFLLRVGLAVLLAGCGQDGRWFAREAEPGDDEAQVYAAVLKARYVESTRYTGKPSGLLVLHEESYAQIERFRQYRDEMRGVSRDTLDDFRARNERPGRLARSLAPGAELLFIDAHEYQALAPVKEGRRDWAPFYARYPDAAGVIFLSRVGFNGARTEALVEVGRGCGLGCGEGEFVFLRKSAGAWRVVDGFGGWMS